MKCSNCEGDIDIITFEEDGIVLVSHGVCTVCLKNIILPTEPLEDFEKMLEGKGEIMEAMVLECSTYKGDKITPKGDRRFSAWGAKVKVGEDFKFIEEHYQLCKRFKVDGVLIIPKDWRETKGKQDIFCFEVMGKRYEPKYLSSYYNLLWIKYLDANPSLVEFAKKFDRFTDKFKGKTTVNCQADVISRYVKEGRASLLNDTLTKEFLSLMRKTHSVREVIGDLLTSNMDIIGHQTNCVGVMGAGIAYHIKNKYPKVFIEYKKLCDKHNNGQGLLGKCQVVSESGDIIDYNSLIADSKSIFIANLFGQNGFGGGIQTQYAHLKTSLVELKVIAKENDLWVGLPYKLGSGLAGGDWNIVKQMIEEVFIDYPVTIYKLPTEK